MVRQTIGGLPGRLFVGLGSRFSRFFSIAACASGLALSSLAAPLPQALAQGYEFADQAELFEFVKQDCGACHGLSLKGGLGKPLLKENIDHFDLETLEEVILDGIPDTAMPPWRGLLKEEDVKAIAKALKDGKVQ